MMNDCCGRDLQAESFAKINQNPPKGERGQGAMRAQPKKRNNTPRARATDQSANSVLDTKKKITPRKPTAEAIPATDADLGEPGTAKYCVGTLSFEGLPSPGQWEEHVREILREKFDELASVFVHYIKGSSNLNSMRSAMRLTHGKQPESTGAMLVHAGTHGGREIWKVEAGVVGSWGAMVEAGG